MHEGQWKSILKAEGVDPVCLTGKQSPCPLCKAGKDRFRFDDKEGRGTWYCNVCGAGDGYTLVERLKHETFEKAAARLRKDYGNNGRAYKAPAPQSHKAMLNRLWRAAVPSAPELDAYMRSRGLLPVSDPCLRYHPACPWRDGDKVGKAPAMLARVYQDGKPMTIHRTFLTSDAPVRKMLMPHDGKLKGCWIPLGGNPTTGTLGVAEGIETALAASLRPQLKSFPVWSCISADQLTKFKPLVSVSRLLIYGDNDATYTGQSAAYSLANQCVVKHHVAANVFIPHTMGEDWLDVHVNHTTGELVA